MKRLSLGLLVVALAGAPAGCALSDPTENTFAPQIINDTALTAIIAYCNGAHSCKPTMWEETLRPRKKTGDNISAGGGNLSVFVLSERGNRRCIRLARYTKTIRLSRATPTACHPPYS
jgi:type V secretory pathway adhesin AidA